MIRVLGGCTGPCQFPTLGFVVDQYDRVNSFLPETFFYISVSLDREDSSVEFSWRRGRLFDRLAAVVLYEPCMEREAEVTKVETKPTTKWCVPSVPRFRKPSR